MFNRKKAISATITSQAPETLVNIFRYLDNHTLFSVTPYVSKQFNSISKYVTQSNINELHKIMHTCFHLLYQKVVQPNDSVIKRVRNKNTLNRINNLKQTVKNLVFDQSPVKLGDFIQQQIFSDVVNSFKYDLDHRYTHYSRTISSDFLDAHYLSVQKAAIKKLVKSLDKMKAKLNQLIDIDENRQRTILLLFFLQYELEMIKETGKNMTAIDILQKTRDILINTMNQHQIYEYRECLTNIHLALQGNSIKEQLMHNNSFPMSPNWKQTRLIKMVGRWEALFSTILEKLMTNVTSPCMGIHQ